MFFYVFIFTIYNITSLDSVADNI